MVAQCPIKPTHLYEFENFRLDAGTPSLWRENELVAVPPKALQILVLLVEKNGEIVSREELLEKVWQETFVEEANINYTISLLRKSLGNKKLVQTVPKRGYRFTAEVKKIGRKFGSRNFSNERNSARKIGRKQIFSDCRNEEKKTCCFGVCCHYQFIFLNGFRLLFLAGKCSAKYFLRRTETSRRSPFCHLKILIKNDDENSLALGLTDSLISRLGSLKRFTIRPLSAVEKFEKSEKDALEFGRELKCDAVLVGTFQTVENRLRVNVRLLDVRDGAQLWTANFDETEADIFILQSKLALQVAGSLVETLTDADAKMLGKEYTENTEAYRAYLRGRTIFDRRVENGFQQILDEYQKAISLDPTFALAYTGLADLFSRRGNSLTGAESFDAYKKAKFYANKALELDGDLAEAHASLGRIKRNADWDWEGAEKEFKRAIELDPNNATALAWYAQMLSALGRHDEALLMINRAIEIDPISPSVTGILFPVLEGRGEFDEGLRLAKEAYLFDKQNTNSRRSYATFLYHKGEYEKVIEVVEGKLEKNKNANHVWDSLLAAAYRKSGQNEKAERILK